MKIAAARGDHQLPKLFTVTKLFTVLPFVRNKEPRFLRMLPKFMLKTQVSTNKKKNSEKQEGLEIEHPACGLVKIVQS